jgi:hypothetical protein
MQTQHDAAPARPTADWIRHYAAEVLASTPGLHPLDAVRQALQATAATAEPGHQRPASSATVQPPARRGEP